MPPTDTSAEAHHIQLAVYRSMGSEQRLRLGLALADEGREVAKGGVRARHPEYTPEEVEDAVRLLYLGRALFTAAWPDRQVPTP